eukprot:TRINITY_DN69872_c0_g1_i1.p1 TRINITY_DN69872_c0_g1~~TRINITY_DN69872_c0_g1_i1.p1  ORF type:complete len:414 (+),score=40.33 TRINITY_DN69872_c0_g1_i1:149-1243(+)
MDDTWAIGFLLASAEVDVQLITTASRCTGGKANIVSKLLADVGRTDIPIGVGMPTSPPFARWGSSWCNGTGNETECEAGFFIGAQAPYAMDFGLQNYSGPTYADGVAAIADVARRNIATTLVAIGPFTNLAALQRRFPEVVRSIMVVAMAGSIHSGWKPGTPPIAAYNEAVDIPSAQTVLRGAAAWGSMTFTPVDTCGNLQLVGKAFQQLRALAVSAPTSPKLAIARSVLASYDTWFSHGCAHGFYCTPAVLKYTPMNASSTLFDVQVAYMVVLAARGVNLNDSFAVESLWLDFNDTGFTRISSSGGLVHVTTSWNPGSVARFYQSVVDTLSMLPTRSFSRGATGSTKQPMLDALPIRPTPIWM